MSDDMTFWEDVLHRQSARDAVRMSQIEARLRNLERPWWKRALGLGEEPLPEVYPHKEATP